MAYIRVHYVTCHLAKFWIELFAIKKPVSSAELANLTGLHERWLREWLACQAAAGIIEYEVKQGATSPTFWLSEAMGKVLADEEHCPVFSCGIFGMLPAFGKNINHVYNGFRTGNRHLETAVY